MMRYSVDSYDNIPSSQCIVCDGLYNFDTMLDGSVQLYNRQRNTGIVLSIIY